MRLWLLWAGLWSSCDHRITEPQIHRMLGLGRGLWGSSSPTLLLKQGHLQLAAQDCFQVGLEYLQRSRIHSLPGQPVPVLHQYFIILCSIFNIAAVAPTI